MCIAAVIFSPLSYDYLKAMEEDNPHGGGVAWESRGSIFFLKGLTAKEIFELQEDKVIGYPYLLHFRWATHGDQIPELTHPFPIGPRALLGELSGLVDKLLIHNGTWPSYATQATSHMSAGNYEFPEELVAQVSDTAIAAWLAYYDENILDSVPWATAVAEMRNTVDENGNPVRTMDITTRGQWYDKEGNWYSNLNWVPFKNWSSYYSSEYKSSNSLYQSNNWESCVDEDCKLGPDYCNSAQQRREQLALQAWNRRNDKKWVGKYSETETVDEFYRSWYAEKDEHKPLACEWADWYDRFDWIKIAEDPDGTSKEAKEDGDKSLLHTANNQKLVQSYPDKSEEWNNYLVSKYGARVAAEVNRSFDADETEVYTDSPSYEEIGEREDIDPDLLSDGDLITDNPSLVNAWLAKQMIG